MSKDSLSFVQRMLCPELARFACAADRKVAYLRARDSVGVVFGLITSTVGTALLLGGAYGLSVRGTWWVGWILATLAFRFTFVQSVVWLSRRAIRRSVWGQLNEAGLRTCVGCGYDLTGNESGVCPECGETVNEQ